MNGKNASRTCQWRRGGIRPGCFLSKARYGPLTERQQELQQRVLANADHLLGLINDILDLSKIEAGRMDLFREQLDLVPMLQGVMATAVGLTKDKGLTLSLDIPD